MQKKKQTLKDMDAQMIATASRIRELRNRKTEESRSSTEGSSYVSESEAREDSPNKQGSPQKGRPHRNMERLPNSSPPLLMRAVMAPVSVES